MSETVAATPTESAAPIAAIETAVETPVVEAAPVVETQKEDDNFAKKFAALSRKEREFQKEREEAKALKDQFAEFEQAKKLAKANPQEFLEKFGVTYEEITEYFINGRPKVDPKVTEIEEKLAKMEAAAKEREAKLVEEARNASIQGYRSELTSFIKSAGEKYELVNAAGAYDEVYNVIKTHFDENKDKVSKIEDAIMSHDDAAEMVEKYLEQELDKFTSTAKIKNKFTKVDPKTEPAAKTEKPTESKTLTNALTAQASPANKRPLSKEESLEAAAKLIRWQ